MSSVPCYFQDGPIKGDHRMVALGMTHFSVALAPEIPTGPTTPHELLDEEMSTPITVKYAIYKLVPYFSEVSGRLLWYRGYIVND